MSDFNKTGAHKIYTKIGTSVLLLAIVIIGYCMSKNSYAFFISILLITTLYLVYKVYKKPIIALNALLIVSFFAVGLVRLIPLPLGLSIDLLLLLTWLILFFKGFKGADWSIKNNSLTYCLAIWMLYCFLELFNPEAKSMLAWFYAVRGLALYGIFLVPLIFLVYNKRKNCNTFINIWFTISILLGLYGAKQYWFGLFAFEQAWLDEGGAVTHVLWGEFTRMFSFSSDANQFGSSQAHAGLVAVIFSFGEKKTVRKIFYYLTAIICFYGMLISGTRGAIIIPIVGFSIYLALSKNYKILILGSVTGAVLLYIIAFTYIFNNVAPIRRMRTAFSATEDASFQVRLDNRANLDIYMADKPFGGGIGSAGVWGKRFSPGNFLSDFETDGQYVRIYAETGIVGLYLYYILHIIIIGKMILISWKLKNPKLRTLIIGFTSGIIALMVANYGAAVTIALPSSVLVLWSMAFVYLSPKWDKGEEHPVFGDI
jgi:hypothetical protein